MEKMDKGLTVPKWELINWPKIPQMPAKISAQIVGPSPKVWDFDEKRLPWASVVRESGRCWIFHLQIQEDRPSPDKGFQNLFIPNH